MFMSLVYMRDSIGWGLATAAVPTTDEGAHGSIPECTGLFQSPITRDDGLAQAEVHAYLDTLWHIETVKRIALLGLISGCARIDAPRCQSWRDHPRDAQPVLTVDDGSLAGPMAIQLSIPTKARFGDGTPAVVFIHGGWRMDYVPLGPDAVLMHADQGFVTVYLNLPGGQAGWSTPGVDDRRGPEARAAVAQALRYAAGELADSQDCTLADRVPDGLADTRVIAGMSNGGNLAWATAGDENLDLPRVDGIATFETPASSQFILVEPGAKRAEDHFFDASTCALNAQNQIACDHGYGVLRFDPEVNPDTDGTLFVDMDLDGHRTSGDVLLHVVWSTTHDRWVHATPAREAAADQDLTLPSRSSTIDTQKFWVKREAPPNMPAAAARFPKLAGIATGTKNDHVLGGLRTPVHITGMVAAMQASDMHWSRLHADASYVAELSHSNADFSDIPSTTMVRVFDPEIPAQPDEDAHLRSEDYFTAAVLELLDRARLDIWDADLDTTLVPTP
jgi:hypothetical protein